MKTKSSSSILLIAKPGYRRNSISTSLHSIPGVSIWIADGKSSGIQFLDNTKPTLVLIDSASLNKSDFADFCQSIKIKQPRSQCFILVGYENLLHELPFEYYDGFIRTNHSVHEFIETIKNLIKQLAAPDQGQMQSAM